MVSADSKQMHHLAVEIVDMLASSRKTLAELQRLLGQEPVDGSKRNQRIQKNHMGQRYQRSQMNRMSQRSQMNQRSRR
jgi:hypothetical protein